MKQIPDHVTIWRTLRKLPETYLKRLNNWINRFLSLGRRIAADATGVGTKVFKRWITDRTKRKASKRDYLKLHAIFQLPKLNMPNMEVTSGEAGDSPILKRLLRELPLDDIEAAAMDSGYLSRNNCTLLTEHGIKAIFIKPKKNTTAKSHGSKAWREMILNYRKNREEWIRQYNSIRPLAESGFSAFKRTTGHWLTSLKRCMLRKELLTRVVVYNLRITAKTGFTQF
jgi:transposase